MGNQRCGKRGPRGGGQQLFDETMMERHHAGGGQIFTPAQSSNERVEDDCSAHIDDVRFDGTADPGAGPRER